MYLRGRGHAYEIEIRQIEHEQNTGNKIGQQRKVEALSHNRMNQQKRQSQEREQWRMCKLLYIRACPNTPVKRLILRHRVTLSWSRCVGVTRTRVVMHHRGNGRKLVSADLPESDSIDRGQGEKEALANVASDQHYENIISQRPQTNTPVTWSHMPQHNSVAPSWHSFFPLSALVLRLFVERAVTSIWPIWVREVNWGVRPKIVFATLGEKAQITQQVRAPHGWAKNNSGLTSHVFCKSGKNLRP